MNPRLKPLACLALLGGVAAVCAAVGGTGTLVGGLLCLLSLGLFCLLYLSGDLGPPLPAVRVPRAVVARTAWTVVALVVLAALVVVVRALRGRTHLW